MTPIMVVEVLSEVGMTFLMFYAIYATIFRLRKIELLLMAIALLVEVVLLVILGSFGWAATLAIFSAFYFWRWKNKKTLETPSS